MLATFLASSLLILLHLDGLACVLGIVAASLACCVCCQCCKAKLDEPVVQQKPPVVVGQPA